MSLRMPVTKKMGEGPIMVMWVRGKSPKKAPIRVE